MYNLIILHEPIRKDKPVYVNSLWTNLYILHSLSIQYTSGTQLIMRYNHKLKRVKFKIRKITPVDANNAPLTLREPYTVG